MVHDDSQAEPAAGKVNWYTVREATRPRRTLLKYPAGSKNKKKGG